MRRTYKPAPPIPPLNEMGPSYKYLNEMRFQMELYDALTDEQKVLAGDYGLPKALHAIRSTRTLAEATAALRKEYGPPCQRRGGY